MKAAILSATGAFLVGAGLVVAGVHILAGPGWALITGGLGCFGIGAIFVRGMR